MSNPIEKIGHGLKVAAVDVEHVAERVVDFLPHAAEVVATAIKDQPEVKSAVLELIKQASAVIASGTVAASDKGIDLAADAATLAAAEQFFVWFKSSFVPLIESVYEEVSAEVK